MEWTVVGALGCENKCITLTRFDCQNMKNMVSGSPSTSAGYLLIPRSCLDGSFNEMMVTEEQEAQRGADEDEE